MSVLYIESSGEKDWELLGHGKQTKTSNLENGNKSDDNILGVSGSDLKNIKLVYLHIHI